jgi:hypothetical protein
MFYSYIVSYKKIIFSQLIFIFLYFIDTIEVKGYKYV